jgi:hypothetical protein
MDCFEKPVSYILGIKDEHIRKNTAIVFQKSLEIDPSWKAATPPENPKIPGPADLCAEFSLSKFALAKNQIFLTKNKAIEMLSEFEYREDVNDNDLRGLTKNTYRVLFEREMSKNEKRESIFTYGEIFHFLKFRKIVTLPKELESLI